MCFNKHIHVQFWLVLLICVYCPYKDVQILFVIVGMNLEIVWEGKLEKLDEERNLYYLNKISEAILWGHLNKKD